ncbi:putative DNA-binding ribbon-helix-helix protein [Roseibium hamelinense]|uniref:Putative DNA-binding ribbon-helix-helix protein n=1 Tax=Roseibium hamelinense TaxID=150831 RepID=A0A562TBB5_9HYPH|nr:ribbon-helix-helix domain-containing protein [Roseibium hamelinense]MTI45402.1 aryl-sulfate sulfotransferase [Roseibium hamelinense]TWI90226.1 putative DNA-binding ribbon-helix-helix protein [Roseibium hamelinense]
MPLVKRSVTLDGHRTSLTLEPEFWEVIDWISQDQNRSMASLISNIDKTRSPEDGLSSSVRVWILNQVLDGKNPAN